MTQDSSLVKLGDAVRLLAEVRTIQDAKRVMSIADAARLYAQQLDLGQEAVNYAAEVKFRAERMLGEMLADTVNHQGGRPAENGTGSGTVSPRLDDLGISKRQSSQAQHIAAIPAESFERHIAETKADGGELTTAGLLNYARGRQTMRVMGSSASSEWYTPHEIIAAVVDVLGVIDLDPCAETHDTPTIPAARHFTMADDGLSQPWVGTVYMNPPYGDEIEAWVSKLVSEYAAGRTSQAIALVPARVDTGWCWRLRDFGRCFVKGRLRFGGSDTSAPFPSMAVYLGHDLSGFAGAFAHLGDTFTRLKQAEEA